MPSSYTTSLRLTLPATGELTGTWGTTVNTGITELLDSAVAGTTTISTWGGAGVPYTLSNTDGAADEARKMFIVATGAPGEAKNVICPAVSKLYFFRNDTTGGFALTLKTSGGSGIAVPAGQYKVLYCNGTNVVEAFNSLASLTLGTALAASSGGTGQSTYTTGDLIYASGASALSKLGIGTNGQVLTSSGTAPQWSTLSGVAVTTFSAGTTGFTPSTATSGAVTLGGTLATTNGGTGLTSFTANGVVYASSSSALTTGSALTFDGTKLETAGSSAGTTLEVLRLSNNGAGVNTQAQVLFASTSTPYASIAGGYGASAPQMTFNLPSATAGNYVWQITSAEQMRLTSTGLGIGTSSPASKLDVYGLVSLRGVPYLDSDGSANYLRVGTTGTYIQNSAGSSTFGIITNSGNLGIGTSSPAGKVDSVSNAYAAFVARSSTSGAGQTVDALKATDSAAANFANAVYSATSHIWNYTGATEGMRLDSSGNLGIGTSSPESKLDVRSGFITAGTATATSGAKILGGYYSSGNIATWGSEYSNGSPVMGYGVWPSSAAAASFVSSTTINVQRGAYTVFGANHLWYSGAAQTVAIDGAVTMAETMRLDSSGNLGIGTSSPGYKLDVSAGTNTIIQQWQGAGTNFTLRLRSGNGATPSSSAYRLYMDYLNGSNTGGYIDFYRGLAGNDGYLLFGTAGSDRMTLDSSGNLGIGVNPSTSLGTSMKLFVNGASGGGIESFYNNLGGFALVPPSTGAGMLFYTFTGGVGSESYSERMRLDSSGNLGIGTTSPSARLHAAADSPTRGIVNITSATGSTGAQLQVTQSGIEDWALGQPAGVNAFAFWSGRNTGNDGVERMRLDSSGNLGIGTTNPQQKLVVSNAGAQGLELSPDAVASAPAIVSYNRSGGAYTQLSSLALQHVWQSGSSPTEGMRLDSSGNLGIGTSSPGAKLDVRGNATFTGNATARQTADFTNTGGQLYVGAESSAGGAVFTGSSAYAGVIGTNTNTVLQLATNGTVRATLDASGNLGLGVTPSAWSASGLIDFSGNGVVGGSSSGLSTNAFWAGCNWYYGSGAYRYKTTNSAGMYQVGGTEHRWYTAPSGTAGNAISFTQAMTLDASGNLQIGTTSGTSRLTLSDSNSPLQMFNSGGANQSDIDFADAQTLRIRTYHASGSAIVFGTNPNGGGNTERARITSGGDLYVGTSSAIGSANDRLQVDTATASARASIFRNSTSGTDTIGAWNAATTGDNKFVQFYTDAGANVRGAIDYDRAGGLVRYNTTSDYRAKDIIGPVQNPGATIDALKVYEGKMKGATQSRPMLVAHEAQTVAPYAVSGEKDAVNEDGTPKFQQMDVSSLVPLLLAEIQSLRARVAALESQP